MTIHQESYTGQLDVCNYCEQTFNHDEQMIVVHWEEIKSTGITITTVTDSVPGVTTEMTYKRSDGLINGHSAGKTKLETKAAHLFKPCLHICETMPFALIAKIAALPSTIKGALTRLRLLPTWSATRERLRRIDGLNGGDYVVEHMVKNIETYADLSAWADDELELIRGISKKSIGRIREIHNMVYWKSASYRECKVLYKKFDIKTEQAWRTDRMRFTAHFDVPVKHMGPITPTPLLPFYLRQEMGEFPRSYSRSDIAEHLCLSILRRTKLPTEFEPYIPL